MGQGTCAWIHWLAASAAPMDQVNTNIGFFDIEISDLTISPAVVMAQGRDRCGFSRKSTRLSVRAWLMFAGGRI